MGPMGQGPMTGRGRGFGGFGGFGFRFSRFAPMSNRLTPESEKAFLQNRVDILARELEDANKRLAELNTPQE